MRVEMEIGEETVDGSVGERLFVEVLREEDETHLFDGLKKKEKVFGQLEKSIFCGFWHRLVDQERYEP